MLTHTWPDRARRTRYASHLRHPHLGLSLVEMLVGITLGIFLIGGAMSMLMTNLKGSQTLLLEARINQDLRATADIISRDLKRSGYWANAIAGTTMATGATAVTSNPYSNITCTSCTAGTSSQVLYGYTKDTNNTLDSNEQFGFKLNSGAVQMQTASGTWQTLTDTNILTVTSLSIEAVTTTLSVAAACATTPTSNSPTTTVRRYDVTLAGQAVSDSTINRTLQTSVRVRNDQMSGACP